MYQIPSKCNQLEHNIMRSLHAVTVNTAYENMYKKTSFKVYTGIPSSKCLTTTLTMKSTIIHSFGKNINSKLCSH